MNQETNIVDIISKLNEAAELLNTKNISSIEKDLILEKIRNIYEVVLLNSSSDKVEKIAGSETIPNEKKEIIEEIINTEAPDKEIVQPETSLQEDIAIEEDEKDQPAEQDIIEPVLSTEQETIIINTESKKASKTLADQYRDSSSKTVSDVMFKSENDISSRIQLKPIKNIKTAISINDRIMFTKELFNNNPDTYNEVVEKVNNMNNITEALDYFTTRVNIHMESEPVRKFTEIIHRRFASS